jgi:hypothetical protein
VKVRERQWYRVFKDGRNELLLLNDTLFNVKDGASQFQNFHANFHKFRAFFSMTLKLKKKKYGVSLKYMHAKFREDKSYRKTAIISNRHKE